MIALITDKVIYEDKDTVSSEVFFFFFFARARKISLKLINTRRKGA